MAKKKASSDKYEVLRPQDVKGLLTQVFTEFSSEQAYYLQHVTDTDCCCASCTVSRGHTSHQLHLHHTAREIKRLLPLDKIEGFAPNTVKPLEGDVGVVKAATKIQKFVKLVLPAMKKWRLSERCLREWRAKRAFILCTDATQAGCGDVANNIGSCFEYFSFNVEYWTPNNPNESQKPTRKNILRLIEMCKSVSGDLIVVYLAAKGSQSVLPGFAPAKKQTVSAQNPRERLEFTLRTALPLGSLGGSIGGEKSQKYIIPTGATREAHDTVVLLDELLGIVNNVPQTEIGYYNCPVESRVLFMDIFPVEEGGGCGGGQPSGSAKNLSEMSQEEGKRGYAVVSTTASSQMIFPYATAKHAHCVPGLFSLSLLRSLYGANCENCKKTGLNITGVLHSVFTDMTEQFGAACRVKDTWLKLEQPEKPLLGSKNLIEGAKRSVKPPPEDGQPWKRARGPLETRLIELVPADASLLSDMVAWPRSRVSTDRHPSQPVGGVAERPSHAHFVPQVRTATPFYMKRIFMETRFQVSLQQSLVLYSNPQQLCEEFVMKLNHLSEKVGKVHPGFVSQERTLKFVFAVPYKVALKLRQERFWEHLFEGKVSYTSLTVEPETYTIPAHRQSILTHNSLTERTRGSPGCAILLHSCYGTPFIDPKLSAFNHDSSNPPEAHREAEFDDSYARKRGSLAGDAELIAGLLGLPEGDGSGSAREPQVKASSLVECYAHCSFYSFTTVSVQIALDLALKSGYARSVHDDPSSDALVGRRRRSRWSTVSLTVQKEDTNQPLLLAAHRGVGSAFDIDQKTLQIHKVIVVFCLTQNSAEARARLVCRVTEVQRRYNPTNVCCLYLDVCSFEKEAGAIEAKNVQLFLWMKQLVEWTNQHAVGGSSQVFICDTERGRRYTCTAERTAGTVEDVAGMLEEFYGGKMEDLIPPVKGSKVSGWGSRSVKYVLLPSIEKETLIS